MTAWTARQPVMRDHGQRRRLRPLSRRAWCSRMPCTRSRESSRGDGDTAVDPGAAFLQGFEDQQTGGEVDAVGGEKGVAFAPGQIFPGAGGVVEAHAVDRPRGRRSGIADPR